VMMLEFSFLVKIKASWFFFFFFFVNSNALN
jgi:hypothetical protein